MIEVLQAQSRHLADVENELAAARRTLAVRKVIERAKCVMMARDGLTEDDAYKRVRLVSMDRNIRMIDIAEVILADGA